MTHDPPRPPPATPATTLDRAHWTPAKQRIFLAALVETGSITRAARAAGMSRSSAHRLRARLAGTPFDRIWSDALRVHTTRLADPFGAETPAASRAQPRPVGASAARR